jgi:hypothetical protein
MGDQSSFLSRGKKFSIYHRGQIVIVAYVVFYRILPEVNQPERGTNSPPSAEDAKRV